MNESRTLTRVYNCDSVKWHIVKRFWTACELQCSTEALPIRNDFEMCDGHSAKVKFVLALTRRKKTNETTDCMLMMNE